MLFRLCCPKGNVNGYLHVKQQVKNVQWASYNIPETCASKGYLGTSFYLSQRAGKTHYLCTVVKLQHISVAEQRLIKGNNVEDKRK